MSLLSELQTRKLGALELITLGFELYLKHFRSFFAILCITILPASIIFNILLQYFYLTFSVLIPLIIAYFFTFFIAIPIYVIVLSIFVEGYVLGKKPKLDVAFRQALAQVIPLINLNIRFSISYVLRSLLFVFPGVIYAVNNGYCNAAFILRGQRGKAAFQYSRALVKGNWWRVFSLALLIFFMSFGLDGMMTKILGSFIKNSPELLIVFSSTISNTKYFR